MGQVGCTNTILSKYWLVELQILHDVCILEKWYWMSLRVQYHLSRMQISYSICSSQQTNICFVTSITCIIYNNIHNWSQNIYICMDTLAWLNWLFFYRSMFVLMGNNISLSTVTWTQINSSLSASHFNVMFNSN